ncbi:MAG: CAP domain-containing protein [Bacteroidota bacterium]
MIYSWLILISFSCSFLAPPTAAEVAKDVFVQTNRYRKSVGLNALKVQPELNSIAQKHSQAMASGRRPFSHQGFDQRVEEVKAYAKKDWRVAENLYATFNTRKIGSQALKDWVASPGHKENLQGRFIFTGIGVARSKAGEYFITQLYVGRR